MERLFFSFWSSWRCQRFFLASTGVSWTLLHEMDYLKYVSVRRDYIVLPEGALTNATRLRWWQPFTVSSGLASPSLERAQWAIDNILVGGSDINPSTLLDNFDDGQRVFSGRGTKADFSSSLPFSSWLQLTRGRFP